MKIEISKEQRDALLGILANSQFQGKDAEFIVELKKALQVEEESEKK